MTDLYTLISIVNTYAANENEVLFSGRDRIKVEQNKIEVTKLEHRVLWDWHQGVPNDFCVFIDVLDPYAAYIFVRLEDDSLKCTLVISDGKDFKDYRELPSLDRTLNDNEIARRLIAFVLTATAA